MELRIQALHVETDQTFLNKIEDKIKSLENQLIKIKSKIEVYLKSAHEGSSNLKVVEVLLQIGGKNYKFAEAASNFEVAFNAVFQTLKRYVVREKEKLQEKH